MNIDNNFSTYDYNTQTGQISYYKNLADRLGIGKNVNLTNVHDLVSSPTPMQNQAFEVTISEESINELNKLIEAKRQRQLTTLSDVLTSVGAGDKAPESYDEIDDTHRAILNMKYINDNNGASSLFRINHFSTLEENAIEMATQHEYLSSYFSDDAIVKRMAAMNLPEDADINFIFSVSKAYGENLLKEFEKNIDITISDYTKQLIDDANIPASLKDYMETDKDVVGSYFKEIVSSTRTLIQESYNGDIKARAKDDAIKSVLAAGIELTKEEFKNVIDALNKVSEKPTLRTI